jgi:methylated-DNA-[protein]-cysteine S-methyltransferase
MDRTRREKKMEEKAYYHSPIGIIEIVGTERGVSRLNFVQQRARRPAAILPIVKECLIQLDEYFKGKRRKFSVKLALGGTDFEKRVWQALLKIPFGRTASYRDIAEAVGNNRAVRAVGNANRVNPVAIIIPCHRVIGSDGSLVGYGSGLWRKRWLLAHEQKYGQAFLDKRGKEG